MTHGTCGICGKVRKMVRDHDHTTGMIRGPLCDLCNVWLGVFEANLKRKMQRGKRRHKAWVARYEPAIREHLKRDTGVLYRYLAGREPRAKQPLAMSRIDRESFEAKASWRSVVDGKR